MHSVHQKILATALAAIIITAVYIVNAQFTNTATIHNTGQISVTKIWARSGTAEDIQEAVDAVAAAGGGIVYVPEGDFPFNASRTTHKGVTCGVVVQGGVSVIGVGKDGTNLTCVTFHGGAMFFCDGSNDKPIRISGITFKGYVVDETSSYVGTGVYMCNGKKFRIDHCRFADFPSAGVVAGCYMSPCRLENGEYQYYWNWGLIDHCDFDNPYKEQTGTWNWGYGINIQGGCGSSSGQKDQTWLYNLSDILGRWDIETNPIRCALYDSNGTLIDPYGGKYFRWLVYIEDCTFARCRYAVASNTGAFYVFRHNTIYVSEEYGSFAKAGMDVHEGDAPYVGGRGLEAYDNIIYGAPISTSDQAFKLRCGGGVIFNNTITDLGTAFWLLKADWATDERNYVKDLWIWSNTYANVGTIVSKYSFYQESIHYFLYERSNYTPYQYPHPFTLSE